MATHQKSKGKDIDAILDAFVQRSMLDYHKSNGLANIPRFTICQFIGWCKTQGLDQAQTLCELQRRFCLDTTLIKKRGQMKVSFEDIPLKRLTQIQVQKLLEGGSIWIRTGFLDRRKISGSFWVYRANYKSLFWWQR